MGIQRQHRKKQMIQQQQTSNGIEFQKLATYKVLLGEFVNDMKQIGLSVDILKYNTYLASKVQVFINLLKYNGGDVDTALVDADLIMKKMLVQDHGALPEEDQIQTGEQANSEEEKSAA